MTEYHSEARFCHEGRKKGQWSFALIAVTKTDKGYVQHTLQASPADYATPSLAMQHGENALKAHLFAINQRRQKYQAMTARHITGEPPRAS